MDACLMSLDGSGESDIRFSLAESLPAISFSTMFEFQPGDLCACYGTDWQSRVVSVMTSSLISPRIGPSHVAMIAEPWFSKSLLWWESTTLCAHECLHKDEIVSGVQLHKPADRIRDYLDANGRVDVYRLAEIQWLDKEEHALLSAMLDAFADATYDMRGALLSGTRLFQLSRLFFPSASTESLFCSELIAVCLMRLNRMNHDNPTRFNPARLLRELVRTGMYRKFGTFVSTPDEPHEFALVEAA